MRPCVLHHKEEGPVVRREAQPGFLNVSWQFLSFYFPAQGEVDCAEVEWHPLWYGMGYIRGFPCVGNPIRKMG